MRYIFLNLKRFDVPRAAGGVNNICGIDIWGAHIIKAVQQDLKRHRDTQFIMFFPEAHILSAKSAMDEKSDEASPIALGSQGVHFDNISPGGNFGAFTTSLPAKAAAALGCEWVLIGHCEERNKLKAILQAGGLRDMSAVNIILGKAAKCAIDSGLNVLYCVGETADEQPYKERVLKEQLEAIAGLPAACKNPQATIVIGYEPVWAIGPGKTPPDGEYIRHISEYIKSLVPYPVVYGGGLKTENAQMLAGIESIDGGLIALTRFGGDFGFYPDEYLEIVAEYLRGSQS